MVEREAVGLLILLAVVAVIALLWAVQVRRRGRRRSELVQWGRAMRVLTDWQPAAARESHPTCVVVPSPAVSLADAGAGVRKLSSTAGDA